MAVTWTLDNVTKKGWHEAQTTLEMGWDLQFLESTQTMRINPCPISFGWVTLNYLFDWTEPKEGQPTYLTPKNRESGHA